ncbi:MAG TPA: hypothetical protein VFH43_13115 [Candidatus Kapabacteria bacterium]|nr:hypothetical protein [Candidatus Kapabacteria bacterium]
MSRGLLKLTAWNYISRLVEFALPTLIFLACAKLLSVEDTAKLSLFLAISAIINVVLGFGLDAYILRYGSELTESEINAAYLRRLLGATLASVTLGIALVLLSRLTSWIRIALAPGDIFLGVVFTIALASVGFFTHLLLSRSTPRATFAPIIISRGLQVILLTVIIFAGSLNYTIVAASYVLASCVQSLLLYRGSRVGMIWVPFHAQKWPEYAKHVWIADLANLLLGRQFDIVLLLVLLNTAISISSYNLGSQIISSIEAILSFGLLSTFLPHFRDLNSEDEIRSEHKRVISIYSRWASPIIGLSAVLLPFVADQFYGLKYPQLSIILQAGLLLLLIRIGALGGNLSYSVLLTREYSKLSASIRVGCAFAGLILSTLLILQFGAIGAIVASQIIAIAVCALETYYARRYSLIAPGPTPAFHAITGSVLAIAAIAITHEASLATLALITAGYLIVYLVIERTISSLSRA